jgi:antitoxin component YwqK of YwqJK toxin-antitoxin module
MKKEYYDDSYLKSEYELFEGLKHGKGFEYYPSGKIKSLSNWVNDTIHGFSIHYYESGMIETLSMWLNGQMHGNYVKYDSTGLLVQTKIYQFNKQCGYEMRYDGGYLDESRHYVLVEDSFYLNQLIRYDGLGNIIDYGSTFYSIYYYNESDTIQINQDVKIDFILETPVSSQLKVVSAEKWDKYFNIIDKQNIDTFVVDYIYITLLASFDKPGDQYKAGIILNPYLDENGVIKNDKFYFRNHFYEIE